MDTTANPAGRDWRLRASVLLTAGWLLLGTIYISKIVGWTGFVSQTAPNLGSFLEGAFAPLAFLWLVVGFFLQQQQLHDNTETIRAQLMQMRRTAEQSEIQARAIAADELHSRQDTFLRVADVVREQLGLISGWIVTSVDTAADTDLWRRTATGETTAFSLELLRRCLGGEAEPRELFFGTEIRARHSLRFMSAFDRLIESGVDCDPKQMIVEAIRDGIHGRVYRMMSESRPDDLSVELDT